MISVENHDDARVDLNTDGTGNYCLIIQKLTAAIGQGKSLKFQTLFRGDGLIEHPKILLTPSRSIFDTEKSTIRNNLSIVDGESLIIAASNNNFDPKACSISLGLGDDHDEWELSTFFFDLDPSNKPFERDAASKSETPVTGKKILTSSPFSFSMKTKKWTRPGNYKIDVQFTYFNGQEWKSDSRIIHFKVLNFIEKYTEVIGLACKYWFSLLRS